MRISKWPTYSNVTPKPLVLQSDIPLTPTLYSPPDITATLKKVTDRISFMSKSNEIMIPTHPSIKF
jgi:hypothetical protein